MDNNFDIENVDDVKGRDLSPAIVQRSTAPKPTWFVRRIGDGYEFAAEEKEVWDILYNKSLWKRRDFQVFGYSDGKTYAAVIKEAAADVRRLEPLLVEKRKYLEKFRRAEEKLIIDEAVDMDGDPEDTFNEANKQKVLRIQKILEKTEAELDALETEYRDASRGAIEKATQAEKEVAIENWKTKKVWPGKVNIITPDASGQDREDILAAMGRTAR